MDLPRPGSLKDGLQDGPHVRLAQIDEIIVHAALGEGFLHQGGQVGRPGAVSGKSKGNLGRYKAQQAFQDFAYVFTAQQQAQALCLEPAFPVN